VVGGIFSISGPASYLGEPERNSLEMVVEEVNAKGGINGHPLKLAIYDDEGDVTKARLHATKLAQDKDCLAVIGPSLTHTSMAALEITRRPNCRWFPAPPAALSPLRPMSASGFSRLPKRTKWRGTHLPVFPKAQPQAGGHPHGVHRLRGGGQGAAPGPGRPVRHPGGGPGGLWRKRHRHDPQLTKLRAPRPRR